MIFGCHNSFRKAVTCAEEFLSDPLSWNSVKMPQLYISNSQVILMHYDDRSQFTKEKKNGDIWCSRRSTGCLVKLGLMHGRI